MGLEVFSKTEHFIVLIYWYIFYFKVLIVIVFNMLSGFKALFGDKMRNFDSSGATIN